jgi:hypothetical protein
MELVIGLSLRLFFLDSSGDRLSGGGVFIALLVSFLTMTFLYLSRYRLWR